MVNHCEYLHVKPDDRLEWNEKRIGREEGSAWASIITNSSFFLVYYTYTYIYLFFSVVCTRAARRDATCMPACELRKLRAIHLLVP